MNYMQSGASRRRDPEVLFENSDGTGQWDSFEDLCTICHVKMQTLTARWRNRPLDIESPPNKGEKASESFSVSTSMKIIHVEG